MTKNSNLISEEWKLTLDMYQVYMIEQYKDRRTLREVKGTWPYGMPSQEVFIYCMFCYILLSLLIIAIVIKRIKVEHRIRSNYTIKIHMLLGHMYIACWISPFIGQSSFDNKLAFHISWIYEVSNINVVRYCSFWYRNIYLYNYFPVWVNIKSI